MLLTPPPAHAPRLARASRLAPALACTSHVPLMCLARAPSMASKLPTLARAHGSRVHSSRVRMARAALANHSPTTRHPLAAESPQRNHTASPPTLSPAASS